MQHAHWEIREQARSQAQPYSDHLERMCPAFLSMQTCRLVALGHVLLPNLSRGQAAFVARRFCGFGLHEADTVTSSDLPRTIADHLRETFLVDFGAEGLPPSGITRLTMPRIARRYAILIDSFPLEDFVPRKTERKSHEPFRDHGTGTARDNH